jgi:hypothetical protein
MKLAGMKWMVVIVAVSLLGGMSYGEKDKGKPELSAAFKAVVKAMFPTASVDKVTVGVEGVKVVEIELKDGEKDCSIDLTEDGTVISVETQVAMKGLPKAVAKAIKDKAGDAEITVVERDEIRAVVKVVVLEKPETVYETKFVKDGKEYELKVAASGAVLAMTLVKEEQEDEEDAVEEGDDEGKGKDADDEDEGDDDGDDDKGENGKVSKAGDSEDEDADDEGDDEGDEDEDNDKDSGNGDKGDGDKGDGENGGDEGNAVSINDVPKPVKKTILKEAKGGTVEEIEREQDDGKVIFDADIVVDGKKFELKVAENGKLLSKEADEEDDQDADKDKEADDEKDNEKGDDKDNKKDEK